MVINDKNSLDSPAHDLFSKNSNTSLQTWAAEDAAQKGAMEADLKGELRLRNNLNLSWDNALVIDLSQLRSTTVSPENHTVRADAGNGDLDALLLRLCAQLRS